MNIDMDLFTIITTLISIGISLISVISSRPTINHQIDTYIYVENHKFSDSSSLPKTDEISMHNTLFIKKALYFFIVLFMTGIFISCFIYNVVSLPDTEPFKLPLFNEILYFSFIVICKYSVLITITLMLVLVYRTIKLHSLPYRTLNIIGFSFSIVTNMIMLFILYTINPSLMSQFTSVDTLSILNNFLCSITFISLVLYMAYLLFAINKLIEYIFFPTYGSPFLEEKFKYLFYKLIVLSGSFFEIIYWVYILITLP